MKGLSQIKLAKNLNVAAATIMLWENGRCVPRAVMVEPIIEFLGYQPEMDKQLKEKQFLEVLGLYKHYRKRN